MDIPSSNFQKKVDKKVETGFVKNFYKNVTSVPNKKVIAVDSSTLLQNVNVPSKYKEFVETVKKPTEQKIETLKIKPVQQVQVEKPPKQEAVLEKRIEAEQKVQNLDLELIKSEASEVLKFKAKYKANQSQKKPFLFDANLPKAAKAPKIILLPSLALQPNKDAETPGHQAASENHEILGYLTNADNQQHFSEIKNQTNGDFQCNLNSHPKTNAPFFSHQSAVVPKYEIESKEVEWWDSQYTEIFQTFNNHNHQEIDTKLRALIPENELPKIVNSLSKKKIPHLKLLPTRDELHKNNRKARLEKQLKIQEEIKYGLRPAPANKVKLSNFHKVYGSTITNPTELEQKVRKEIEEHQKRHLEHNEARKLNKAKKKEKLMRKVRRDSAKSVIVSLYIVPDLKRYENQFKILRQAKQYWMNGLVLCSSDLSVKWPSVVIIEAGPKYSKKFDQLIKQRMTWPKDAEGAVKSPVLIWKGVNSDQKMKPMSLIKAASENDYIQCLKDAGFENMMSQILSNRG